VTRIFKFEVVQFDLANILGDEPTVDVGHGGRDSDWCTFWNMKLWYDFHLEMRSSEFKYFIRHLYPVVTLVNC
jgi:hypothetical protein